MEVRDCDYAGLNRKRAGVMGRACIPHGKLAVFVEAKYNQGWKDLTVTFRGRVVGRIEPHPDKPRGRVWWTEDWAATPGT